MFSSLLLSLLFYQGQTYKIAVLIFGDSQFHDAVHAIKNAYLEVFGSLSYSIGNYTIEPEFIDGGNIDSKRTTNRLHFTSEVVCGKVLNGSVATVIYATSIHRETRPQYLSLVSTAVYALSFYQLPAIGVMVRDAEFSKKKVYPSFVRPTPTFSDESHVFITLLERLSYRQVVVVSVKGKANGDQFVTMFEEKRRGSKIHVQRYIELDVQEGLNNTLMEEFEEVTSNIIVLFATKHAAEAIFAAASELTGNGKVWIVSEGASKASNVPDGVIAPRLSQSPLSALRDSFSVVRHGLNFLETLEEPLQPPESCKRDGVHSIWIEKQAPQFLESICSVTTAKIEFNSRCERVSVDYEIINMHEGPREVGTLHGSALRLNEASMKWPGGAGKPLEISLPKHLRVVTTHDPPFVYTTPIIRLTECVNLGKVEIKLGGKSKEIVSGPWYPCPRFAQNITQFFCCAGYAIDLLSNISLPEPSNSFDTSFSFSLHLNGSYGSVLLSDIGTGYYLTGALGELDSDLADLAVGGMTINPEREKYIDFSEPWLYHGIRILEKSIPRDSPMQSFLQPLKSSLWTALLVSVVAVGLAIFFLDKKSPFDRFYTIDGGVEIVDALMDKYADDRVTFGEAMWFVWGVLLNSGVSEKTPRSCSARVLGIVWCGFTMIMVASYTANLAAFLVLDQPEKGLTGVTDPRLRNPSANFSFGTVLNSNVYQYFKRHVELSTMFRKMEAHNVKRVDDAVRALKNGSLDAFIFDSTRLDFEAARHCELRTRGALFGRSAYGIGLQKNSPWTPHITAAILRMSESGKMESLDAKWISAVAQPCAVEVHKSPARLGLWNMKDVFILVTGGVAAGAIFSFIEVVYGRKKASDGRKRALAQRYTAKWKRKCRMHHRHKVDYNLSRPLARRGFAGLEYSTLRDYRLKMKLRNRHDHCEKIGLHEPFRPDLNFKKYPVVLFCSRCRHLIETDVHKEHGLFAYTWCVLFAALLLWPCSPLPFFMESFADFVHICPVCTHTIGKFRRCRKTKFYIRDAMVSNNICLAVDIFLLTVCILQILVNFLVLYVWITHRKLRKNDNLILLVSLAFIDFAYAVLHLPYLLFLIRGWNPNNQDFNYDPWLILTIGAPSAALMKSGCTVTTAIAIDRVAAVYIPVTYYRIKKRRWCTGAFILSLFMALLDRILVQATVDIVSKPKCPSFGCFVSKTFRVYWGLSNMFVNLLSCLLTLIIIYHLFRGPFNEEIRNIERLNKSKIDSNANSVALYILLVSALIGVVPGCLNGLGTMLEIPILDEISFFVGTCATLSGLSHAFIFAMAHREIKTVIRNILGLNKPEPVEPSAPSNPVHVKNIVHNPL